jgi:uncharacterized membrane-anchored protein
MFLFPTSVKRLAGRVALCAFLAVFTFSAAPRVFAQDAAPAAQNAAAAQATPEEQEAAARAAFEKNFVHGPANVPMSDQATLALPAGTVFIPEKEARLILENAGSKPGDGLLGIILPEEEQNAQWLVVASYDDSGYVKDDEAADLDADKILDGLKEGVKESNKRRASMGIAQLEITGWIEPPHYDHASHKMIWSVSAAVLPKDGQAGQATETAINYNTLSLGRRGYVSLNLVTDPDHVAQDKQKVALLLSNLHFDQGKTYADFDSKTDKIAKFGLLALIGGLAVKKLGLFAVAAGLAAKFGKVLVVAVVGVVAAIKKFFTQGRRDETLPPPSDPQA